MSPAERYFDNAATTPVDPRVLDVMSRALANDFGNPNSLHQWGRQAQHQVELAREAMGELLGVEDPFQITFTSGATESNNWVLRAFPKAAVSPFEHASVIETATSLGRAVLPNDGWKLEQAPPDTDLVSVMTVNNETGSRPIAPLLPAHTRLHTDLTQTLGKVPCHLEGVEFASWSAHKFYGPKGVGGLYSATLPPFAFQTGGEQEHGNRAGTLNAPAIIGMGEAARIAIDEQAPDFAHALELRCIVLDQLSRTLDFQVNESQDNSPFILCLSFLGIEGETAVIEMDQRGFGISSGAACSTQSTKPSRVLTALGMESEWIRGTIRISFGRTNSPRSAEGLGLNLAECVKRLRGI